jgi:hypothetical protein
MLNDILIQVLYGVLIIASVFLIAVLWRAFEILSDFKEISSIIKKRVKELNQTIAKATEFINSIVEAVNAFITSFGVMKNIKDVFDNKKKENDGK